MRRGMVNNDVFNLTFFFLKITRTKAAENM